VSLVVKHDQQRHRQVCFGQAVLPIDMYCVVPKRKQWVQSMQKQTREETTDLVGTSHSRALYGKSSHCVVAIGQVRSNVLRRCPTTWRSSDTA